MVDLLSATIAELSTALRSRSITAEALIKAYIARIGEVNDEVRAVIAVNSKAVTEAQERDHQFDNGQTLGVLHGIPILVKANQILHCIVWSDL